MKINDVKARVEAAGLMALEQRGFYSHFIRIRTPDYHTLGTIDIGDDGEVPDAEVERMINRHQPPTNLGARDGSSQPSSE
ncbi:hypothetical protein [Paenirhodobacter populi]|uniref:Uncharacterized protein n=1 Tax=Paenirhodobacter populi TaxID=2306993 RepID=A0A443JRF6_9RHOB|nr:hypothetical protein [Sinirhodobacter populi]RWR23086.1 hypothetical protein D2T30_05550 [Sinirhodobacter populi]